MSLPVGVDSWNSARMGEGVALTDGLGPASPVSPPNASGNGSSVKRAHIGCPELVALMPPRPRVLARLLVEILVIAFFLVVGWSGYTVLGVLATDHLVSLPAISVGWVQSVVPTSAALIIAAELLNLPRALADAAGPRN